MAFLQSEVTAIYRRLLGYLDAVQRRTVIAASLLAGMYAVASAVVPSAMESIVGGLDDEAEVAVEAAPADGVAGDAELTEAEDDGVWNLVPLAYWPLVLVGLFAVRGTADFLIVYTLNAVGRAVVRDLRAELFSHYLGLPASYYDRSSTGTLLAKLTYNTEQVAEATSNAIAVVFRDTLTIVALLVWMISADATRSLTLLVSVIAPVVALVIVAMSRAFRRYSARIQTSMGDVTRVTEQSLQGQRVIKIFAGEEQEKRHFCTLNERNYRLNVRIVGARAAGDVLTQFVVVLGVAAVIFAVSRLIDELTASDFIGFITAMGMLLAPLKRLTNVNAALQRGIAAASSLFEVLDEPLERDTGSERIERARGDVEYRDVVFGYMQGSGHVLRHVSFTVPAGKTVALVGQSGSGKSTLASLLPRFYDVESGVVLLDGRDVRDYRLADLRRQVSLVSQDVVLFDDTIANNIAYGALAARSREEVERAAEAANVTDFAAALPQGLDSPVGERGMRLSGGQRQRVAIARALLKDTPVLVLDEATSALDTESERRVQEALARLMQGRTTLVIAHRLSTVEKADRIVVLREGAIVETGTHDELLAAGGYYASLYRMQFSV
jgi:subfamily B ATP-binding cassette protein MsbA